MSTITEELLKLAEDHKEHGNPFAWARTKGRKFVTQVEINLGIGLSDFELEVLDLSYEILEDLEASLVCTRTDEILDEIATAVRDLLPLTNWPIIRKLYFATLQQEVEKGLLFNMPRSGRAILNRVLEFTKATAREERAKHEEALMRLDDAEECDHGVGA